MQKKLKKVIFFLFSILKTKVIDLSEDSNRLNLFTFLDVIFHVMKVSLKKKILASRNQYLVDLLLSDTRPCMSYHSGKDLRFR